MSVVHALAAGTAKNPLLMHFFTASFQISIRVAGTKNIAADALSRNNMSAFYECTRQANKEPSPVPPQLLDLLIWQQPDWTLANWRKMFLSILARPLHPHPLAHTRHVNSSAMTQPRLLTQVLCLFVDKLGKENLTHQTIKCYLLAIQLLFALLLGKVTHLPLVHYHYSSTYSEELSTCQSLQVISGYL